jgi:hypothetical protein
VGLVILVVGEFAANQAKSTRDVVVAIAIVGFIFILLAVLPARRKSA